MGQDILGLAANSLNMDTMQRPFRAGVGSCLDQNLISGIIILKRRSKPCLPK